MPMDTGFRGDRFPAAAFFNQRDSFSRYRGAALAEKCSSPPASRINTAFETVLLCRTACPALLARCPALIAPRQGNFSPAMPVVEKGAHHAEQTHTCQH